MPIFDTIDQVTAYILMVTVPEVTDVVSELGVETLNKTVEETVYREAGHLWGKSYENTYGLMDKAKSQVSKYGKAEVASRVHLSVEPDERYPSFYMQKGNEDNSRNIVSWLDSRKNGGWYKGNKMTPPNHNFMEKTAKKLIKGGTLKSAVQDRLKTLGYVISRTLTGGGE